MAKETLLLSAWVAGIVVAAMCCTAVRGYRESLGRRWSDDEFDTVTWGCLLWPIALVVLALRGAGRGCHLAGRKLAARLGASASTGKSARWQ